MARSYLFGHLRKNSYNKNTGHDNKKGEPHLIQFYKKSPTTMMMMMQNHGLKGYSTGCEPAGYHHHEMGGVKPVRVKNFLLYEASNSICTINSMKTFVVM